MWAPSTCAKCPAIGWSSRRSAASRTPGSATRKACRKRSRASRTSRRTRCHGEDRKPMNDTLPPIVDLAAEGDVNRSPHRRAWEAAHVGAATRGWLDRDSRHFLHQSLSTPCFDALVESEGIWLTDADGRRYMDFHGNNVHQVGYRHPHVIAAVKRALDTLPFSPRRFTNAAAIELAEKLDSLAPGPLLPGTEHVPPCDPRECRFGCAGACTARCAEYVDYVLGKEGDVAAVVVETIRCTDVQIPPPNYYRVLRDACDRHGA